MILLTTPDYPPKLGGLATHTQNVEKVLRALGLEYRLFVWKSYRDIVRFPRGELAKFDYVFNIHSGMHMFMPPASARVVNFVNGAEILFYSPHPLKRLAKRLTRRSALQRVQQAHANFFISQYTFEVLQRLGLRPSFDRDLILPMCVETAGERFVEKDWSAGPLRLICVARDVPHKNFAGCIALAEFVQDIAGRQVELVTVTNREFRSDKIRIESHINPNNEVRDELLRGAHLNLLLSLNHEERGFFEGFGQIVQEAAIFGTPSLVLATGGLPESVHHQQTGWVLPDLSPEALRSWWQGMSSESYRQVARFAHQHTLRSHGLDAWRRMFARVFSVTEGP